MDRMTSNNILELKDNEIFVFGSNTHGLHAGGAAVIAHKKFGAKWGIGKGKTGKCYAIPTIEFDSTKKPFSIKDLQIYITNFINYASKHSDLTFLVTEIGCGIAGFKHEEIAPLFKKAITVNNIYLPERFWNILKPNK